MAQGHRLRSTRPPNRGVEIVTSTPLRSVPSDNLPNKAHQPTRMLIFTNTAETGEKLASASEREALASTSPNILSGVRRGPSGAGEGKRPSSCPLGGAAPVTNLAPVVREIAPTGEAR